jgi:NAD(P)-dependent dehydrogenase (short-subunit alcohol dehydrogenase family)
MADDIKKVCVVVGVGPGNGAALARRFAADGYSVALLARSATTSAKLAAELSGARSFECDVGDPLSVARAFASIREELGEVDVVAYNAGSGVFGTLDDVSASDFESSWRVNALGLFLVAKEVVPSMKERRAGAIIVIGATASRRGVPRTTVFAPAKAAQKGLCEALARQLGPSGIHVALIIVDGVVDLPRTREWLKDKPDDFFIQPDAVADLASFLVRQDKSAWSFEVEARPFGESW